MISARGLTKRFGDRLAVEDLTFDVGRGEIVALLGPNGAGKTTTVRLLLGLLRPTAGEAKVAGFDCSLDSVSVRSRCGFLPESPGFYSRLTAAQNLEFFGTLAGIGILELPSRIESALRRFDLHERRDDPFGAFSRGMQQKLALARAMLHDPDVLFLDEPTSNLAPEVVVSVRKLLLELKAAGKTIVLCTHNLDEAMRIADRVAVLKTRLLAIGSPGALISKSGRGVISLRLALSEQVLPLLGSLPFVSGIRTERDRVTFFVDDTERSVPEIVRRLVAAGIDVHEVRDESHSLEAIYLEMVR